MKRSIGPAVKDGITCVHVQYDHLGVYDNHGDFALFVRQYDAGDCDTIQWPLRDKDRENLVVALFDMAEMGYLTEKSDQLRKVILPDGSVFDFS